MPTATDYIGRSFGEFTIVGQVGHGTEAEVLACKHVATGITYVLRLDVNDDELWDNDFLLPPRNASLERRNAQVSWMVNARRARHNVNKIQKDLSSLKITPDIYAVIESRYLIPVASPVRVRGAWDVDRVLRMSPPTKLPLLKLWEDIIFCVINEACENELQTKAWRDLLGGQVLLSAIHYYLDGCTLTSKQKGRVVRNISINDTDGPEFAENLLLRLWSCVARGCISLDEARATLRCIHFRRNVTKHDAQQMLVAASALQRNQATKKSLAPLAFLFKELSFAPLDPFEHPDEFEICDNEPDLELYELFLQEHVGFKTDVLTLAWGAE